MSLPKQPFITGQRKLPKWREKLSRALRPPRTLKVTRAGRTYLVVTVGVGLGALNTGNNLLYLVLALQLSLIVISGILSERVLRGLSVRRIGADAAFAGEPFSFRWAVTRQRGHAFALEFGEADAAVEGTGRLAHLPPGEERIVRGELTAERRGPHALVRIRVTTQFPFGLFQKSLVVEAPGVLHVYPRRLPQERGSASAPDPQDGQNPNPRAVGGVGDVTGLSPLRDGEEARRIHGPWSASLGQWVKLDRARDERRQIILRATTEVPSEALERECERLAAQARRLVQAGHEVGFESESIALRPAAGVAQERRILRALGGLGFAESGAESTPEREAA